MNTDSDGKRRADDAPQAPDDEFGLGCISQEEHDEEFNRGWELSEAIEQHGINQAAGNLVHAEKSKVEIDRINKTLKPAQERVRLGVKREPRDLSDLEFLPSPEWEMEKRTAAGYEAQVPENPLQRGAATLAMGGGSIEDEAMGPERRLARLRALGGAANYRNGEWRFRGIANLVASEKAEGRKRYDEKTIRADLREAAQLEHEAKRAGHWQGLGG